MTNLRNLFSAVILAAFAASAFAQSQPAPAPGRAELIESLNAIAAKDLAARRDEIASITTRQAAEVRQIVVREKILKLLNGLPERTPLNARTVGTVQCDGFHIEKVIYESQPHFYITALLYIPDGKSFGTKFPAILMSPGHSPLGKAGDYGDASNFARNGFIVLSWDPIGQGERLQYPDPKNPHASLATRPTGEHGEASLQPMLIGDPIARYFVWDAMRGIDYLVSRPEVDPFRIGAYGCSGGGAITALVAALDPRVAATGVACYNTSFDVLFSTIGAQDGEQSIPGFIDAGLDFPDWIELVAPRPYAEIATYDDMFPFAGARATAVEARRFYSLFDPASAGKPAWQKRLENADGTAVNPDTDNQVPLTARFQFLTGPGHHGALAPMRKNILGFFLRNLRPEADADNPIIESHESLTPADLQVTETGQVASSLSEPATVYSLNLERAEKLGPPNDFLARHWIGLNYVIHAGPHHTKPQASQLIDAKSGPVEVSSYDGIRLRGVLAVPGTSGQHPAVLMLVPDSILADNEIARANKARFDKLAADGNIVLAITPTPSLPGTDDMKSPLLGPFYLLSLRADLVGRTLLGLRVDDVALIVHELRGRSDVDLRHITAEGSGHMGLVLLYAASGNPALSHITVTHVLESYESLLHAPLPIGAAEDIVPGALRYYDIPDLVRMLGPRATIIDPAKGTDDLSRDSTPLSTLQTP